jgi:hypothetical protein
MARNMRKNKVLIFSWPWAMGAQVRRMPPFPKITKSSLKREENVSNINKKNLKLKLLFCSECGRMM